jgi:hypothetical protein
LFTRGSAQTTTPEDWVRKGVHEMRTQLARGLSHEDPTPTTESPPLKQRKNRKTALDAAHESAPVGGGSAGMVGAAGAAGGAAGDAGGGGGGGGGGGE